MAKRGKLKNKSEVKKPVLNKSLYPDYYNYILFILFTVFIALFTSFKISGDDDVFWHLETGRYILESKTIPSADIFGFVTAGSSWVPFEWGWDVLSYFLYSISGYTGLSVFRTLLMLFIFYLLTRLLTKLKLNPVLPVLIFIILLFGMADRLSFKPQLASYLFFAVILYVFISYRTLSRGSTRLLYLLPVIFLLWCNMHMGVIAGMGIFTLFVFSELWLYFRKKNNAVTGAKAVSKTAFRILLTVYFLSIALLLVNPHGFYTYSYVYSHLNMKMLEDVFEWYSPFNKVFAGTVYYYIYIFFLICCAVLMYISYKRKDMFTGLTAAVFAVLSVNSSRFTIDFMLITSILYSVSAGLYPAERKTGFYDFFRYNKIPAAVLSLLLVILSYALINNGLYRSVDYARTTGFGIDENDYPVKMFDFIKQNNLQNTGTRPFNSFGIGGYLIWELKESKNFIDSRNLNDDIYFKYKSINNKLTGFETLINEMNFDWIIWHYAGLVNNSGEVQTSIVSYLINNSEKWKLVYWDDNSFLFVKNEDKFADIINRYEYKYVNPLYYIYEREPLKRALSEHYDDVIKEIRRKYKAEPGGSFINSMVKSFKVTVEN